jgi:acetaldehyde dehydrogenase/alcohol dehydrogenase
MPHGRAVGIALPYSLEYISSNPTVPNAPDSIERLSTVAKFVGIEAGPDQERIQQLIRKIRDLKKEIGEPLSLKEAGISEKQMGEAMDTLIGLASIDVNMLSSPCECKGEKLEQLFQDMWEGKVLS